MNLVSRAVAVLVVVLATAGCSAVWSEEPQRAPKITPAPEPSATPYAHALAADAKCITATADQLSGFNNAASIGGAVKYTKGVLVHANGKWWAAALHTEVYPNDIGYTRDSVPETAFWVTNQAALSDTDFSEDAEYDRIAGSSDDPAVAMAAACLKKLVAS